MASRSRRRSGKNPTDWVVTTPSWTTDILVQDTADAIPLTQHAVMADPLLRAVPQVEQSVVAIRGQIWMWPTAPLAAGARGLMEMRITVRDASVGGVPAIPAGYDLLSQDWADEQFLWHRTQPFVSGGTWLEPEKRQVMVGVDVNVKVRRRLEPMQILILTLQWSRDNPTAIGDITYWTRLRTLVKYMSLF